MLTDKLRLFYESVNTAIIQVGRNAAKIADRVLSDAFPETSDAAEREGADKMLRHGVIKHVTDLLKEGGSAIQHDFAEIHPGFMPIVDRLSKHSHYVPGLDEYVHVGILIQNPEWLDAARKFKRQKGEETLAEADVLDELFHAVIGSKNSSAPTSSPATTDSPASSSSLTSGTPS